MIKTEKIQEIRKFSVILAIALTLVSKSYSQFYNGSHLEFGKNRVQYDVFDWKYYRFKKFETYFYTGGEALAIYTSRYVNEELVKLEQRFNYSLVSDRIQFIIYNKQSHFKQSNIGLNNEDDYNIGGRSKILGSRVFLYFEGDHKKLEQQIKSGMAEVLLIQLLYGSNWREVFKNTALLYLPDWYVQGLVSQVCNDKDVYLQGLIHEELMAGKYDRFNRLENEKNARAGKLVWSYIEEKYGPEVIPNILYMTKITHSIETGFLYILGKKTDEVIKEAIKYHKGKFETEISTNKEEVDTSLIKTKRKRDYYQFKINPVYRKVAYVTNQYGQYRIWIEDLDNGKKTQVFKTDLKLHRITDRSYPVLNWHPSGEVMSFTVEHKGNLLFYVYTLESEELMVKEMFNLEKVLDFAYNDRGNEIVMSAIYNGQTDLYLYNFGANFHERITNDIYDDLTPKFINHSSQIIFSSNRPNDTLEIKIKKGGLKTNVQQIQDSYDLFIYDYQSKSPVLERVTPVSDKNEWAPEPHAKGIRYLSLFDGTVNSYNARYDSTISYIDTSIHYNYFYETEARTNYKSNILEHQIIPHTNEVNEVFFTGRSYLLKQSNLDEQKLGVSFTEKQSIKDTTIKEALLPVKVVPIYQDTLFSENRINIDHYQFDAEKKSALTISKEVVRISEKETASDTSRSEDDFSIPNQRNYNLSFSTDESVSQLNNTFLNGNYQLFNGGPFQTPGVGATFKFGISDLFEDYKIFGGIRLSLGKKIREYFVDYQDFSKRLDKEIIISRSYLGYESPTEKLTQRTNAIHYSLCWPFNEVASIRGLGGVLNNNITPLSTNPESLMDKSYNAVKARLKGAFVYDNSRPIMTNIRYGVRFKVFAEYFQEINLNKNNMLVVGLDYRRYTKLHKEFILVNRFATSASFGKERLIYYLGSVDDWWKSTNTFNFDQPIDQQINYAYQSLAPNLRGFVQNIRNGTSFAVINNELRLPVFKYLLNKSIKSEFLANFEVVGFGDIGVAWNGLSPYSDDNILESEVVTNTQKFGIRLIEHKDPLVGGYGFGLRSILLGYFVRADWGWGVENGTINEPIFYLSLSLDI